ncbi:hypothetical protein LZZ85_13210 [Terrimonas sp. NA20]|uniref:DUF4433 domain-containing protein n=1 Tax=Terrimonas ginsenosidimutans TaxID=2908004 RepID=A0ABS9KSH7_9BACT|nr:hypothetical protein [Terrimonas ginsenosidimutans]MCG2615253.1 hypothetical protein [Terrimonas ginsenosidimutans]
MQIASRELYELLKSKGIKFLHHANTVRTALTFIQEDALLSRAYVEANLLDQTEQYSDGDDKRLGIWDAVFVDGWDLHKEFGRNNYGPVLFKFPIELLLDPAFRFVRITKTNPANWTGQETKFFKTIEEVNDKYLIEGKFDRMKDAGVMFLIEKPEKTITLSKYCTQIILDDPDIETLVDGESKSIFERVKSTLEDAITGSPLKEITISKRHPHNPTHGCYYIYRTMYHKDLEEFHKLFRKKQSAEESAKDNSIARDPGTEK